MGTWMRYLGMTRDARTARRMLAALFAFALMRRGVWRRQRRRTVDC